MIAFQLFCQLVDFLSYFDILKKSLHSCSTFIIKMISISKPEVVRCLDIVWDVLSVVWQLFCQLVVFLSYFVKNHYIHTTLVIKMVSILKPEVI